VVVPFGHRGAHPRYKRCCGEGGDGHIRSPEKVSTSPVLLIGTDEKRERSTTQGVRHGLASTSTLAHAHFQPPDAAAHEVRRPRVIRLVLPPDRQVERQCKRAHGDDDGETQCDHRRCTSAGSGPKHSGGDAGAGNQQYSRCPRKEPSPLGAELRAKTVRTKSKGDAADIDSDGPRDHHRQAHRSENPGPAADPAADTERRRSIHHLRHDHTLLTTRVPPDTDPVTRGSLIGGDWLLRRAGKRHLAPLTRI
jgi:hypothetical protein